MVRIGAVDSAWENSANWSCGSLPDSNTDVTINATAVHYPEINSNASCRSLTLQPEAAILVKTGYKINITNKIE
jgi:hypothetical protein